MENRFNALKWWNKQPKSKRQLLCEFEFGKDRDFNTLTGREIEIIYTNESKSDAEIIEMAFNKDPRNRGSQKSPFGIGS